MTSPSRAARAAVLLLLAGPGALLAAEGGSPADLAPRVAALVERIKGDAAEDRTLASRELAQIGLPGIEHLVPRLPDPSRDEAWKSITDSLAAMGAAPAAAELLSWRSACPPRARDDLDALGADLLRRTPATLKVPLQPGVLPDPRLVPPSVEFALGNEGKLDAALTPTEMPYSVEKGVLRLDTGGKGRFETKVLPAKPTALAIGPKEGKRTVFLYARLGAWFAGPAAALTGKLGKESVLVLDVDEDGAATAGKDFLQIGEGTALRPIAGGDCWWTETGLVRIEFAKEAKAYQLLLRPEPPPARAGAESLRAQDWLNRWRRGNGLPPLRLDRPRSEACRRHSRYMSINGLGHDEQEGKTGFTPEGKVAGLSSSVGPMDDPVVMLERLHATVLHRTTCVGSSVEGIGVGCDSGMSTIWTEDPSRSDFRGLLLVPGAGQARIPRDCGSEMPRPDMDPRFYETPRGYPVSAAFRGVLQGPTVVRLDLFEAASGRPVEGFLFSPERPYTKGYGLSENYGTAQFVAKSPLLPGTSYVARFSAETSEGPVRVEWSFHTQ